MTKRAAIIIFCGANLLILYFNFIYFGGVGSKTSAVPSQAQSTNTSSQAPSNLNSKGQESAGPLPAITIRFELNRLDFSSKAQEDLLKVFNMMSENTSLKVEIGGHTDNIGDPIKNIEISVNRAKTVRNHLIKLGIAPERLIVQGYGETKPIADNKTEDGQAQNRRVEIIPLKDQT